MWLVYLFIDVQCPSLLSLQHASPMSNATVYGSKVAVLCDVGYSINGSISMQNTTLTCSDIGQWQPVNFTGCLRKFENFVYSEIAVIEFPGDYSSDRPEVFILQN
jgi:Sushi repeat (SCR repeat)